MVDGESDPIITNKLVWIFAVAAGVSVANLYYIQPLLHSVSRSFAASSASTGLVVTFTQVGYALGLVLIVPLGDLVRRRRLVLWMLGACFCSLMLSGFAQSLVWLFVAISIVGFSSVVVQVLVPYAASIAPDASRGKIVGMVMSGLLVGILLARTLSGLVAEFSSWRMIYFVASALMVILAVFLYIALPDIQPSESRGYFSLLRSIFEIIATDSVLRARSLYGAASFGMFSVLWTTLAFLLSKAPFYYSNLAIGLFGLAGAVGAGVAWLAGRLVDRSMEKTNTIVAIVLCVMGFVVLYHGRTSLWEVVVGIVVLDMGAQGLHVTNQAVIYRNHPEARSRTTTVYMFTFFIGGTIGSALASELYGAYGWSGVCALGLGIGTIALVCSLGGVIRPFFRGVPIGQTRFQKDTRAIK